MRIAEDDTNTLYWVYTDGDGTQHYFYETSSGVYEDEDGLGLKITLVSETGHTNFKMIDDYGNETYFRDGILTYTKDAYGNGIYYCYNYSTFNGAASTTWRPTNAVHNQLTSIWQLNNGGSSEQLARFVYDSNNNITGVYDEAGRETLFYYNTSGGIRYLDYVVYPDGAKADYTYNTYGMTCAYDQEANYGICYTYDSDGTVNQFYEYYLSGTTHVIGNIVSCWNGLNRSSYRDWGADHKKETSDDLRQEVLFDNWGRTVCTYTTNTDSTEVLGSSAASYVQNSGTSRKNNRTLDIGSSGMTAVNLLIDGGIEKSTDSWTSSCSANASAAARTTITNDENRRHGTGGLNLYLSSSATSSNYAGIYRSASLTGGKPYTLSAYFSASSYMNWNSGAKLELLVQNSSGTTLETHLLTDAKPNAAMEDGWQRVSATYTPTKSGTYRFLFKLSGCNGTAYLDDLQLEQAEAASTYNLLQNGSFENTLSGNWSINGMSKSSLTTTLKPFGTSGVKVTGSQNAIRRASQTITLNCSSDTTFLLSGWALAEYAAPNSVREYEWGKRYFGLIAEIIYTDTSTAETQSVPFEWSSTDWQCSVGTIVPKRSGKTVKNIHIYCAYDYNSGTAWFDNISLRQEPVQTYAYNAKGNVSSVTQSDIATEKGEYASNGVDLTSYTAITGVKYSYTYNGKHDIAKEEGGGLTTTYTHDTSGNTTGSQMKGSDTDYTLLQSTMTPDRNHTASVTDTNGSQTSYTYNASTEQLTGTSTYNPETGKTISTNRVYNASNGRQTQMYIDGALSMSYAYKNGGLSSLTRKSYRNGIGQWQSYGLAKDVWGNTSAVTVSASTNGSTYSGTRTLASYTYAANNGNLTGMTCGNGDSISYSYDSFDRLIKTRYNDTGDEILYTYNAEGSLAQLELRRNSTTVGIFSYEYDSLGRLIRSRQTDGTNTIQRTEHLYDAANRLKQQNYTLGNKSFTTNYTYSSTDGLLTSMKTAQGATIGYTYDGLKRQKKTTVTSGSSTVLTTKYAYRTVSGDQTSTQPEYYKVIKGNGDGTSTATILEGAKYTYDAAGNITMIAESISPFRKLVEYQYDKQNQLVSAKYYTYSGTSTTASSTTTYTYAYDTAGNLLTEKKNGATVKTYTYGDSGWNDLLTSFRHGGKTYSISYDGSGNPTSYPRWQDNTSYYMSWSNGRQLTYMDYATTASNETQIRYAYDANGIRSSKKVNNTVHSYVTQSGKVVRETIGSGSSATIMDFIYDNQGLPFALNYSTNNGSSFTTYYYVLNLQGDVVKLVDGGGTSVASYAYDAWGKILSSSGSKAEINPLRYRGYYYDTETGFYYLQSRYYDPVTHRFINADAPEYSEIAADSLDDTNLFAYCSNNPVMRVDETGELCSWLKKTIAAVAIVAAVAVVAAVTVATAGSCTAVAAIAVGAAKGAAIGMVVGGATGAAQGAVSHRLKTGSWKGAGQAALEGMGDGALTGAITGAIQGGMSGYSGYLKNGACFVAGTTVATATGLVVIEKIRAGDLVWAWDEETGDVALKPVVETYINETTELTHIFVKGEEIVATPTHPFYCPVKGWTDAAHLRAGDILVLFNGEYAVVEKVQHELLENPVKVYNFQVADYHTYYVSDNGVLVHNSCVKQPGTYEISTSNDQVYVGKGSASRMNASIRRLERKGYEVIDAVWQPSRNNATAFVDEYMKMAKYNFDFGGKLINKIMSPGFKIFNSWL